MLLFTKPLFRNQKFAKLNSEVETRRSETLGNLKNLFAAKREQLQEFRQKRDILEQEQQNLQEDSRRVLDNFKNRLDELHNCDILLREKTGIFRSEMQASHPGLAQKIANINLYSEIENKAGGLVSPYVIDTFSKDIEDLQFNVLNKKNELMRLAGIDVAVPKLEEKDLIVSEQLLKQYNEHYQMKKPDLDAMLDPAYRT